MPITHLLLIGKFSLVKYRLLAGQLIKIHSHTQQRSMDNFEFEYMKRFQEIANACSVSPYQMYLPRTNKTLVLRCINSLLYADIQNMFHVLREVFGSSVPEEIKQYIPQIAFVERLPVEDSTGQNSEELVCFSFISSDVILKFRNWLLMHASLKEDDDALFQKITMNHIPNKILDFYSGCIGDVAPNSPFPDQVQNTLSDFLPDENLFSLCQGEASEPLRIERNYSKPRGKHMPARNESSHDRPFACEFHGCRRAFKRLEHLKRHLKMHTGERPYKCLFPGCSKSFSRSDNLNSHYKTHNIVRRKTFSSYDYGKSFENY